ncbi:molybdate transport system ATP-binding protein [Kineococcus xinjiangensis]|uniref:Molybdate transport system ATP-binding protein n=1 Tax=Kineococcus xinjiangensis TaxID=512762 RepID=A0A2S6IG65_9ACTN|nr:ABC transporter ATP-binding protein [Kineococcus xinjiangensis]PPK93214.1 molybdate transport system ATP-binding protein [Kineococcus xinjiangensis]
MSGLQVRAEVPARGVELDLSVAPGEVVAVLGPNGAGKSTLLALVAGLLRPARGRVVLDGTVLVDTAAGVWVPAHRRGAALLAQEPLLFPHLSAAGNVAFGPRARGAGRRAARVEAQRWLAAVGAVDLAARRPGELSGGQAQRVALARALAARPQLLLLDEPLAALDVGAAAALRGLLRRVLREGRPALLVTHDPLDALALADRALVLEAGRVVEDGPAREVLTSPRTEFAARLAGLCLVRGRAVAGGLELPDGTVLGGVLEPGCRPGEEAVAVFGPGAVAVRPGGCALPGGTVVVAEVVELEPRGEVVRVRGRGAVEVAADVPTADAADLDLVPGTRVGFAVDAAAVRVRPAR